MIVHGLENANMPTVWADWDMGKGMVKEHKKRQTRVLIEMVLIMGVRAAFHVLMLLPIIFTGISFSSFQVYHIYFELIRICQQ